MDTLEKHRWKGWFAVHRHTAEGRGDPLARSRIYEFECAAGPNEVPEAYAELCRLWKLDEAEIHTPAELMPGDPSLTVYPYITRDFGEYVLTGTPPDVGTAAPRVELVLDSDAGAALQRGELTLLKVADADLRAKRAVN
jgi:hypothetical protein